MTRRNVFLALAFALCLWAVLPQTRAVLPVLPVLAQSSVPEEVRFDRDELAVVTRAGRRHVFTVELAISDRQRARGLMYREHVPDDEGMLFDFKGERHVAMWMKNTLVPLDMLFIDNAGRVVHIVEEATPGSLEILTAGRSVRAVLELAGGSVRRLGLAPGDRIEHPMFKGG